MFNQLTKILRWFTNLTDVKRVIAIMAAFIMFLTYFFIKRDKENARMHIELKKTFKDRLDICETYTMTLQQQVSIWKDSLANEKLIVALKQIEEMKQIANKVKQTEFKIKKENIDINSKLKVIENEK